MNLSNSFHLFDVRGPYPREVNERLAFIIGQALINLHNPEKILVASDIRDTSPILKRFLIDGLLHRGIKVFDLAEVPIPQFYYTMATGNIDLGIMVTASHISDDENGFKFCHKGAVPFNEQEIVDLQQEVSTHLKDAVVVPRFEPIRANTTLSYSQDLYEKFKETKFKSKIVIDATRSSVIAPVLILLNRLGIDYLMTSADHEGNPLIAANRKNLAQKVLATKSDLGIMWDSDGDRVVFLDRHGELIPIGFALGLLAAGEVRNSESKKVAVDVRAGLVVRDLVEEAGGSLEIFPSWAQFIKFAMKDDRKFVFGGEMTSHFMFKDHYLIDDGIYSAFKFLKLFEEGIVEDKLKELKKRYFELPETNFSLPQKDAPKVLETMTNRYRSNPEIMVQVVDGLSVTGKDFKFNLRESVTEPFLRLNLEAKSARAAEKILTEIKKEINNLTK